MEAMQQRFASIGQGSDRGHRRESNEDALRVDGQRGLLLVADGMGGHPCGDVASRVAADAVVDALAAGAGNLIDAIARAEKAVLTAAEDGTGMPGMGTTCVACRGCTEGLEIAWVGDSRCYRLRDGRLEALTRDHNEAQYLVDEGLLKPEQAQHHPGRHMLARALGLGGLERSEIDCCTVPAAPGDRALLCSDGLTGEIGDERIAEILNQHADDQTAVDALIEAALAAGGHDNVTAIVATVE
jgi:protein phosphatase